MVGIRGEQVELGADGIRTENIVPGALAATVLGRALMAAGFFGDEATFSDKVGVGAINGDRLVDLTVSVAKLIADITFAKMLTTGVRAVGFNGLAAPGQIPGITGVVIGDRIFVVWRTDGVTLNAAPLFNSVITANDSIEQVSASDLSLQRFVALVIPALA